SSINPSFFQLTPRRIAQNKEAAGKSHLRRKGYVQQLEFSRLKLKQDFQRAPSQI
ncbi:TGACG-sequence-specific DNA-binding protein TGA-2.1, partial [Stylosanthes scabra]|nr:TGACG-sequence-specific DNA-binding protein TGA-2.1 [Stylosanthes scabra]